MVPAARSGDSRREFSPFSCPPERAAPGKAPRAPTVPSGAAPRSCSQFPRGGEEVIAIDNQSNRSRQASSITARCSCAALLFKIRVAARASGLLPRDFPRSSAKLGGDAAGASGRRLRA